MTDVSRDTEELQSRNNTITVYSTHIHQIEKEKDFLPRPVNKLTNITLRRRKSAHVYSLFLVIYIYT